MCDGFIMSVNVTKKLIRVTAGKNKITIKFCSKMLFPISNYKRYPYTRNVMGIAPAFNLKQNLTFILNRM